MGDHMPQNISRKKQANDGKRVAVKIKPDPKADTPSYYINYAAVMHSEYDFSIAVMRMPTQLTPEQTEMAKKRNTVLVEPILELIVAPRLVDGLIRALSIEKEKYEREHGPIRSERQRKAD
jgi:hypothetical protein